MNKQELMHLRHFSDQVGHFIRYWGFRKIHGEIWALVYLSKKHLSGAEIVTTLKVSKALVSPALKELEEEGLILLAPSENSKTKRYKAEEDIGKIIRGVLLRRESPLIGKIHDRFTRLQKSADPNGAIDAEHLEKLGRMVGFAQEALVFLCQSGQLWA